MLRPFALFRGNDYYPCGGWEDLFGQYVSLGEAVQGMLEERRGKREDGSSYIHAKDDWWHVIDVRTGRLVAGGHREPCDGYRCSTCDSTRYPDFKRTLKPEFEQWAYVLATQKGT